MPINSFEHYPLTWKPDKQKLTPPYYKSLAEDLETQIKNHLLKPGTKLPPQREIADYLDLNYTTITRVYEICKKKGLIYGKMGKGTFVSPHPLEDLTITTSDLQEHCIEMGSINSFSEYSSCVEKAMKRVIQKGYLKEFYDYSTPVGHPHQRSAGVQWMEQLQVHTDIEHTMICSGSQNALAIALISLFHPGDKIATDQYTYPNIIELAKMLHLVLVPIHGDRFGMCADELEKQCMAQGIQGIYLMPTYSNPTTITIPLNRRRELAHIIHKHHLILLEDDISAWLFAAADHAIPSMFDLLEGQGLYICGMTKSLCPGLRIAYMTFPHRYLEQLHHGLFNINIKTSSFDAEIISELILNGDACKMIKKKYELTKKADLLFQTYFPEFRSEQELPKYFHWIPISDTRSSYEIENSLMKQGIRVYHANRFSVQEQTNAHYLRVSLCSAGNFNRLAVGLGILEKYVHERTC